MTHSIKYDENQVLLWFYNISYHSKHKHIFTNIIWFDLKVFLVVVGIFIIVIIMLFHVYKQLFYVTNYRNRILMWWVETANVWKERESIRGWLYFSIWWKKKSNKEFTAVLYVIQCNHIGLLYVMRLAVFYTFVSLSLQFGTISRCNACLSNDWIYFRWNCADLIFGNVFVGVRNAHLFRTFHVHIIYIYIAT